MKISKLVSACAASLFAIAAASHASADQLGEGFYVGGGYSAVTYSESGFPDADLGALFIRGGYQINDYLAAEVRLGDGVQDDSVNYFGYDVKLKLKDFYGIYLKAGIPTEMGLYPYVIIGDTHMKGELSVSGFSGVASSDGSDVSYGVGVDYWINKNVSAGLEYMNFYDKDGIELSGFTLGLNYKF